MAGFEPRTSGIRSDHSTNESQPLPNFAVLIPRIAFGRGKTFSKFRLSEGTFLHVTRGLKQLPSHSSFKYSMNFNHICFHWTKPRSNSFIYFCLHWNLQNKDLIEFEFSSITVSSSCIFYAYFQFLHQDTILVLPMVIGHTYVCMAVNWR